MSKKCINIFHILSLVFLLFTPTLFAQEKDELKVEKEGGVIEIKGESRNFNMKLVLKNKKDKITFVKTRRDFKEEILSKEP